MVPTLVFPEKPHSKDIQYRIRILESGAFLREMENIMARKPFHPSFMLLVMLFACSIACGVGDAIIVKPGSKYEAKSYGGTGTEQASAVAPTSDRGYVIGGYTSSWGIGYYDFWVMKFDSSRSMQWQKTYGGANYDTLYSIEQTKDGGYIAAGSTNSFGAGHMDIWVLKLENNGNIQWQKAIGTADEDVAYSIIQTDDGGYLISGYTYISGFSYVLLLKFDGAGATEWSKAYRGLLSEEGICVRQTLDDGYIVAGNTNSFGAGGMDILVMKLDSNGDIIWEKSVGGAERDEVYSLVIALDGGCVLCGATSSFGASEKDAWVLKLNTAGNIDWQKRYVGENTDLAASISLTDGGYIVSGNTTSFGFGGSDLWMLKLAPAGSVIWQKAFGASGFDGADAVADITGVGRIAVGNTASFGMGGYDVWSIMVFTDQIKTVSSRLTTNTFASVFATSAAASDTALSVFNPSLSITDTAAVPIDTDATVRKQYP